MSLVARGWFVVVIAALVAVVVPTVSEAGVDLGQVCIQLLPFSDTVRLGLTTVDGSAPLVHVTFRWRNGAPGFQVAGTGALTEGPSGGGAFEMALVGSHNTAAILGGNKVCSLFVVLNPASTSWQVTCVGAPGLAFTANGTIGFVSCTAAMDADRPPMSQ